MLRSPASIQDIMIVKSFALNPDINRMLINGYDKKAQNKKNPLL